MRMFTFVKIAFVAGMAGNACLFAAKYFGVIPFRHDLLEAVIFCALMIVSVYGLGRELFTE